MLIAPAVSHGVIDEGPVVKNVMPVGERETVKINLRTVSIQMDFDIVATQRGAKCEFVIDKMAVPLLVDHGIAESSGHV